MLIAACGGAPCFIALSSSAVSVTEARRGAARREDTPEVS